MTIGSSTDNQKDGGLDANNQSDVDNNTSGLENGADSSTAQDDNKPKDIESAVRNALGEPKVGQSSSSGDNSVGDKVTDPAAAGKDGQQPADGDSDLTEAELNLLKPRTRRSFERMRGQIADLEAKVQDYDNMKPMAEKLANLQNFCVEAGLNREDVNTGFEIMRLMKTDPVAAYEAITPIYQQLQELIGEVLPPDLQQQVAAGRITPEHAQEVSRLRAENALTKQQRTFQEENSREIERKNSVVQLANAAGNAVSDLEKQWASSDPDYRVKSTRIAERIELELLKRQRNNTLPKSAAEAKQMALDAKAAVDAEFKRLIPKKSSVQSVLGVGTSTGSKPAPKNLKEAIQQSIGQ